MKRIRRLQPKTHIDATKQTALIKGQKGGVKDDATEEVWWLVVNFSSQIFSCHVASCRLYPY